MAKQTTFGKLLIKKYLFGFTLVIVFSLLAYTAVSSKMAKEQTLAFCKDVVGLHLSLLEQKLLQTQKNQRMMAEDTDIREIIAYHEKKEEADYLKELRYNRIVLAKFELFFRDNDTERAYIVDSSGKRLYSYKTALKEEGVANEDWFLETVQKIEISSAYFSGLHHTDYLINAVSDPCISMVMPISKSGGALFKPQAYLVCDLAPSKLLESSNSQITLGLQYGDEGWLFTKNTPLDSQLIQKLEQSPEFGTQEMGSGQYYAERFSTAKEDVLALTMKAKSFGIRLVGLRPLTEEADLRRNFFKISALTLSLSILLSVFVSRNISQKLSSPIRTLMEKCDEVSNGDYSIRFDKGNILEIDVLGDAIQNMLGNMLRLNEQKMREEKRASKQKLEALQHQINPHFINNVLQTIKALALEGKMQEISKISTYLGKIMAYSVYRPHEDVTLAEELEHLENYLQVQNIRYNQKIAFAVECDEGMEGLRIPKLTLQPLVENAIEHARSGEDCLIIHIHAQMEDDGAYILIHDNGAGIEEENYGKFAPDWKSARQICRKRASAYSMSMRGFKKNSANRTESKYSPQNSAARPSWCICRGNETDAIPPNVEGEFSGNNNAVMQQSGKEKGRESFADGK